MHTRNRRRFSLPETLLALTACMGILSVLWLIASSNLGLTLVSFQTGSMSPTMPAGTIALTIPTPADRVEVGDVVTVQRQGELPITHRVVEVEAGGSSSAKLLTLRGDDNAENDASPYEVTEVGTVAAWIPGAAPLVGVVTHPAALGLLIIVIGGLLVWALFPEKSSAPAVTTGHGRRARRRVA